MSNKIFDAEYAEGATPLDPNELDGLLLPISTQLELNQFEKQSILNCMIEAERGRKLKANILTVSSLKELHRKMLSPIWLWAGEFRKSEKNIGIAPHQIQIKLDELCKNTDVRSKNIDGTQWPELAAYFHHALVFIHPFVNGNGRHARLATDILSLKLKMKRPTWGEKELILNGDARSTYLNALRKADRGNFQALIEFMFNQ